MKSTIIPDEYVSCCMLTTCSNKPYKIFTLTFMYSSQLAKLNVCFKINLWFHFSQREPTLNYCKST